MENNNNNARPFTNSVATVAAGNRKITLISGSIFQRKADFENGDPIIRSTSNGRSYITISGTYNRKAAAYAWGDDNLAPADENGNVHLFINCSLTDDAVALVNSCRAAAYDNIQILGACVTGAAKEGQLPALWLSDAQPVHIKARGANGEVKLEKNMVALHCKGNNNEDETISVIRGVVNNGYNGAPAVSTQKSSNGNEYSRLTIKAKLSQHDAAVAFGESDGNHGPSDQYIRCTAFSFTHNRIASANLDAGDSVTVLGRTSLYTSPSSGKSSKQMTISRLCGYRKAENAAPAASAAPAKKDPPAPSLPALGRIEDDFTIVGDEYDLPF